MALVGLLIAAYCNTKKNKIRSVAVITQRIAVVNFKLETCYVTSNSRAQRLAAVPQIGDCLTL